MSLMVRDADGSLRPFDAAAESLGIGVTEVSRRLEVVEVIVTRLIPDGIGPATAISAHEGGLASLWTNESYNPSIAENPNEPFRRWVRTLNMKNGNVGIGGSKDPEALDPQEKLVVVGNIFATGDVRLAGSDCAEEFSLEAGQDLDPGTVVVVNDDGGLRACCDAYDRRVAGILSGAGTLKPGILLGRTPDAIGQQSRAPLALAGRAYCKVDAHHSPIKVGDLLTTSTTVGHAMKARSSKRAFGAVLGKALQPLTSGQGLIPVLVALQ